MTSSPLRSRLKTLGALGLLLVPLPAVAGVTAVGLVRAAAAPRAGAPVRPGTNGPSSQTVLLSGAKMTKTLTLARAFHAAGHRVVLVESARYRWAAARFSRAVDVFATVPEPTDPGYPAALLHIVREQEVDVFVPVCSPVSSRPDAQALPLLSEWCEVIHAGPDLIDILDDKAEFAATASALGLTVPETHRITDPEQVTAFDFGRPDRRDRRYVLKSIAYDPVHRLDLTPLPRPTAAETAAFARSRPISPDNPWILQEFVVGQEYCTHGTVRHGELRVWACCRSSAFQVNYAMVDKPAIQRWVRTFVGALGLTGQASFDFIETADGTPYAIECNPRTHSAVTLFADQSDALAGGYLDDDGPAVVPAPDTRPTYWLHHELWRMARHPGRLAERIAVLRRGRDALHDPTDPLPFLLLPYLQIGLRLLAAFRDGRDWVRIDFNIGKLVEAGGD